MSRMRLPIDSLAILLDLPADHTVTDVEISGEVLDVVLDGDDTDEVVAEYIVDVHGHRTFSGFRAPEGAPETVVGDAEGPVDAETTDTDTLTLPTHPDGDPVIVEETLPPSGKGSRGKRRTGGSA